MIIDVAGETKVTLMSTVVNGGVVFDDVDCKETTNVLLTVFWVNEYCYNVELG